jgi:hypothetical protein
VLEPDGAGGVQLLIVSQSIGPLSGSVLSSFTGANGYDQLDDPYGAVLGYEVVTVNGGETITQFLASGAQYAATIEQSLGGGATELQDFNGAWSQKDATITYDLSGASTLVETFDGNWDHVGAVYTLVGAAQTVVQDFDGSWNQLSASITTSNAAAGTAITQYFNSAWSQTSATYVLQEAGGGVQTQYFDSAWNQTSATVVTNQGGVGLETQYFNADWAQVSATIVSHPAAGVTTTQYFDSAWDQLSADIVTVSGGVTSDQQFDGSWNYLGEVVSSALNANTELIQSYAANGDALAGSEQMIVQVQSGLQVYAAPTGIPTTFVIRPGDLNGDAFTGFVTAGMSPYAHDVLAFEGYGPTATLTQIDASHWQISAQGLPTEVFTLAAALNPASGDVVFR